MHFCTKQYNYCSAGSHSNSSQPVKTRNSDETFAVLKAAIKILNEKEANIAGIEN